MLRRPMRASWARMSASVFTSAPEASHTSATALMKEILCACELTADSAWQIAETFDKASGVLQAALLAPASSATLLFEHSQILDASSRRPQRVDLLKADITLQCLQREAVEELTAALAVSGHDAHPAEGAWRHVPCESQTAHAARAAATIPHRNETPRAAHTAGPAPSASPAKPAAPRESTQQAAAPSQELEVFPALLAASQSPSAVNMPHPLAAPGETGAPTAPYIDAEEETDQEADAQSALPWMQPDPAQPAAPACLDTVPPGAFARHLSPNVPVIRVLGSVEISGISASRHGTREAQLAALLHLKPGRSADTLSASRTPSPPTDWPPALTTAISRLDHVNRPLQLPTEVETEQLIRRLLDQTNTVQP